MGTRPVFVCVCNGLREKDCRAAAEHPDTCCAGCVYRRLGCRVRCGACMPTMRDLVAGIKGPSAAAPRVCGSGRVAVALAAQAQD